MLAYLGLEGEELERARAEVLERLEDHAVGGGAVPLVFSAGVAGSS